MLLILSCNNEKDSLEVDSVSVSLEVDSVIPVFSNDPVDNLNDSQNLDSDKSSKLTIKQSFISALNEISNETAWFLFGFRGLIPPEEPFLVQEVSQDLFKRIRGEDIKTGSMDIVYEKDEKLYKFLGFLDPKDKLGSIYLNLITEQIPGFYSLTTGLIHVVADTEEIAINDALLLAFVQGLAMQESHFQISNQRSSVLDNRDTLLSIDALSIGDSLLSIGFYGSNRFPEANLDELRINKSGDVFQNAPTIVQQMFLFPFTFGIEYVHALRLIGGWGEVNSAYSRLPHSSTEIIHPQKYIERFTPNIISINNFSRNIPENWKLIQSDVWGEFLLLLLLGANMDGENAAKASSGWLGDKYALIQNEISGNQSLVLALEWESNLEAEEFIQFLSGSLDKLNFNGESNWKGILQHPVERFVVIEKNKSMVLLIISSEEESADSLMREFDERME